MHWVDCSPSILLTGTGTGGIPVKKLARPGVDSPPWGVGNREPPNNHDLADIIGARTEALSIEDLKSVCLRIGVRSTEILMHVLSIGEGNLQGELNRLCSHSARRRVHTDSARGIVSSVYTPSISGLGVSLDGREELIHRHVVVMLINVQIFAQEPLFQRIWMERVTRCRKSGSHGSD